MKNLLYALVLLVTITSELFHLAYMLSFEHDTIELAYDFKGENESEESKDVEEEASEIPSFQIHLDQFSKDNIFRSKTALTFLDDQFGQITTPPPDHI